MEETFGIAAFRSRQQVLRFESELRRNGLSAHVMSTPREIQVGCGLSVRFEEGDAKKVMDIYRRHNPGNLIGFYRFTRRPGEVRGRIAPML